MKPSRYLILAAALLIAASAGLHYAHYLIFRDAHHVFIYLFGDIAFLPLEVFLVALVIDRLVARHEKAERLRELRDFLGGKRDMLVMLLGNPSLLEHESFTDLLWAIFHLLEELSWRESFDSLPPSDLAHLAGDVRRVYTALCAAWLRYCQHLQRAYPYIFSVVVRTHPLQEKPCATVTA